MLFRQYNKIKINNTTFCFVVFPMNKNKNKIKQDFNGGGSGSG
jgi:hypothetical protein